MFRYPDKPVAQLGRDGFADLPEIYLAQLKMDGWRCVIERNERAITFTSRHKKPIPISAELREQLGLVLSTLPVGTMLDAEWLARRPGYRSEALWVFDAMMVSDMPMWTFTTERRFALLHSLLPGEMIVPYATHDYAGFFDAMRNRADAEGIVLKRRDAPYIGSYRQSALNAGWLKCKWRAGEDGLTPLEPRMSYVA
jgi:ATP-dependent DNA ligase